jgi:hypothetical protein
MVKSHIDNEINKKSKLSKFLSNQIVISVLSPLILALVLCLVGTAQGFLELPGKISKIETSVNNLQCSVENLTDRVGSLEDRMNSVEDRLNDLEGRIERLESVNDKLLVLQSTSGFTPSIEKNPATDECVLAAPKWQDGEIIAVDSKSGEEYSADQLVDQRLLLSYKTENNEEVFFYGQFNQENHWNGNCLINMYTGHTLSLIMEAEYDDGNLLNYKQIIPFTTKKGDDVWIVSERTTTDNINSGDSWSYYRDSDQNQSFDYDNVVLDNLFSVTEFKKSMNGTLESFYHGNTSNGYFNDDTGNAYYVKYAKDGTIRTLYSGNFKDGLFQDNTGNAWYITREENTNYMYYKGNFVNGNTKKDKNSIFTNDLTIEDINNIISKKTFRCDLIWFEEKNM